MYLHFRFHPAELKPSFPRELGEIQINFSDGNDFVSSSIYNIDSRPFFSPMDNTSFLNNLNKVNLFIGANNSGKSRFLRSIFKMNGLVSIDEISPIDLLIDIQKNELLDKKFDNEEIIALRKQCDQLGECFLNPHYINKISKELFTLKETFGRELAVSNVLKNVSKQSQMRDCIKLIEKALILLDKIKFNDIESSKSKLYVPIYRSLIADEALPRNSFNEIVKNKYRISNQVYTGLSFYFEVYELHTSIKIRELRAFSEWIKKNFYPGKEVDIVPDKQSLNVYLDIDGHLRPIFDLGDGIQQLILLIFPIYTSTTGTWFFIEEPETHLHPGLQRIFLETLLNDEHLKTKNLRFFFTTHSNHFLDISINHNEISVFQFEKENANSIQIKTNIKPGKEILDLLGINTSSVFLSNTSIWVEGPTDRKYLSKWLKLYCEYKKFAYLREDIDFAFFEYGGNLVEHYLFDENFEDDISEDQVRDRIKAFAHSNKIFLLADNDNATVDSSKGKRRKKLQDIQSKQFLYFNTDVVEIENLLPPQVLIDFVPEVVSGDKVDCNMTIIRRNDYKSTRLGDYLEAILSDKNVILKKFKASSGTLTNVYKSKLCDFVVDSAYTYTDLTEENPPLEKLIESLYNFIKG